VNEEMIAGIGQKVNQAGSSLSSLARAGDFFGRRACGGPGWQGMGSRLRGEGRGVEECSAQAWGRRQRLSSLLDE
jgi:hypothetical protein